MSTFDLNAMDESTRLCDRTPPGERHFFSDIDNSGLRIEKSTLPGRSTYGGGC
jgi:hypothetical protein